MSFLDNYYNESGILIQARSNSSRLPGKIFLTLTIENQTKTILEWIYFRLNFTNLKKIYFVLPEEDQELIKFCKKKEIPFLLGPLDDVRERYIRSAKFLNLKYIIRVTADNPFLEPLLIEPTLKNLITKKLDLFSFIGLPLGVSIEGFTFDALTRYNDQYNEQFYKEHVSLHIKKNPDKFSYEHQKFIEFEKYYQKKLLEVSDPNKKEFFTNHLPRLTLDEQLDYETFLEISKNLKINFTIFDIMDLYFSKTEIFLKNLYVEQRKF